MYIVLDDGIGQMCNKLLMHCNVLTSAYIRNQKVVYFNMQEYNGFVQMGGVNDLRSLISVVSTRKIIVKILRKVIKLVEKFSGKLITYVRLGSAGADSLSEKAIADISSNYRIVVFDGWPYYDLTALREAKDIAIKYMKPSKEIQSYLDLETKKYSGHINVGVHIRRGDYREWIGGRFYFSDQDYKYYMDQIYNLIKPSTQKNINFIIFSNENIDLNNFQSKQYSVAVNLGNAAEDFHMMSTCDYLIGPPSTFSGMASFVGQAPRYIMVEKDKNVTIDDLRIWLEQTDGNAGVEF